MNSSPGKPSDCTRTAFLYAIKIFGAFSLFRCSFSLDGVRDVGPCGPHIRYDSLMADRRPAAGKRQIRSEARGPHWVAWVADTNGKPEGAVVLVGETREEAEERARQWGEQTVKSDR